LRPLCLLVLASVLASAPYSAGACGSCSGSRGGGSSFGLFNRWFTTTAAVGAATIAASVSKLVVMLRPSSMSRSGRIGWVPSPSCCLPSVLRMLTPGAVGR
jgi:hypothetical protein